LKQRVKLRSNVLNLSPATCGRGLKLMPGEVMFLAARVARHVRAWIETVSPMRIIWPH